MKFKAIFLDFYETLVHEDDDIIPIICEQIKSNTSVECSPREIGSYWWKDFLVCLGIVTGTHLSLKGRLGLAL